MPKVRTALVSTLGALLSPTALAQCDYGDWECFDMYPVADVPVRFGTTHDDDVPSPLLIYLHSFGPYGGSGENEEDSWLRLWPSGTDEFGSYIGLQDRAVAGPNGEETGWIYALPDGALDPTNPCSAAEGFRYWNANDSCCAYNYMRGSYTEISGDAPDHATYLNDLIDHLVNHSDFKVDPDRIYFFGYSNGGYMAHRMACQNGDVGYYAPTEAHEIAAVGSYAGVNYFNPLDCYATEPTNVLHVHDIGDQVVLYDGGVDINTQICWPTHPRPYAGALSTVATWLFLLRTEGEAQPEGYVTPLDLNVAYSTAQRLRWSGGRYDAIVEHWRSLFGSHEPTFSMTFRTALVDWFTERSRPGPGDGSFDDCPTDLNRDGRTDGEDLMVLLSDWDEEGLGDLDASGRVDGNDLTLILAAWGDCG